jgi:hypothetical protein
MSGQWQRERENVLLGKAQGSGAIRWLVLEPNFLAQSYHGYNNVAISLSLSLSLLLIKAQTCWDTTNPNRQTVMIKRFKTLQC